MSAESGIQHFLSNIDATHVPQSNDNTVYPLGRLRLSIFAHERKAQLCRSKGYRRRRNQKSISRYHGAAVSSGSGNRSWANRMSGGVNEIWRMWDGMKPILPIGQDRP